jgi:hypothetical protein
MSGYPEFMAFRPHINHNAPDITKYIDIYLQLPENPDILPSGRIEHAAREAAIMTFKSLLLGARKTPWKMTGNASASASVAFFGLAAGTFTFKWSTEPYSYEYPWGATQVSAGPVPVGFSFSPSEAPSILQEPGVYLMPATTSDLISTDFVGPFFALGGSVNGGPGTYVGLIFLGTSGKLTAGIATAAMTNPATFTLALTMFKAVVVVWGTQVAIPGAEVDFTTGWIKSRRVY